MPVAGEASDNHSRRARPGGNCVAISMELQWRGGAGFSK
jgi:hypothetical protein